MTHTASICLRIVAKVWPFLTPQDAVSLHRVSFRIDFKVLLCKALLCKALYSIAPLYIPDFFLRSYKQVKALRSFSSDCANSANKQNREAVFMNYAPTLWRPCICISTRQPQNPEPKIYIYQKAFS